MGLFRRISFFYMATDFVFFFSESTHLKDDLTPQKSSFIEGINKVNVLI